MWTQLFPPVVKYTKKDKFETAVICTIIAVICLSLLTITVVVLNSQIQKMETNHQIELQEVHESYEATIQDNEEEIDNLNQLKDSLQATIDEQATVMATLHQQLEENRELEFELYHKYWYVIRDADPNGGLTMDDIAYMDALCKERNFNAHWIWSVMHTESGYNVKAQSTKSTARGLGQVLSSTARSMYERFMGNPAGSYNHEFAYDAQTNIAIVVEYCCYLKENYSTAQQMIYSYRGLEDEPYYNAIRGYLSTIGSDINIIDYEED